MCVCVLAGGRAIRKELSFTLSSTVPSSSSLSLSRLFIGNIYRATEAAPHCTALLYITGRSVMQFSGTRLCVCFLIADRQTRTASAAEHTQKEKRRRRENLLLLHLFPPRLCRSFVRSFDIFFYFVGIFIVSVTKQPSDDERKRTIVLYCRSSN